MSEFFFEPLRYEPLFIGKNHIHLPETDSTNKQIRILNQNAALPEGAVVSTGYQSAGRGQAGAIWDSAKDQNIMASVLLYPKFIKAVEQFGISKAMALAVHDFVSALSGSTLVKIKWPNDILVSRQKICGILIENGLKGEAIDYCIVGIGINVNEIPDDKSRTSLKCLTGLDYDLGYIEKILFSCIEVRYLQLKSHPETISQDYLSQLLGFGIKLKYRDNIRNKDFDGTIIGINTDGRLMIESDDGLKLYSIKEVRRGEKM